MFDALTALTFLDLNDNALTDATRRGVRQPDRADDQLWLTGNALAALRAGVFDGLTLLTDLHLGLNALTALPDDVFEPLTLLTQLALYGNPGWPFVPTAVALPDDGTVPVAGGTVTLNGSSSGPWGTNVDYEWELTDPASGPTFDDTASATPVVTIPPSAAGSTFTFTLTVTRGARVRPGPASDTDTATVTARVPPPNAAPVFTSAATFNAEENQTSVGTVEASDSDADDSVTDYAIQAGADVAQFSIVASSGVLTFVSAPNFEAAADADTNNDYVVVVRASSGTGAREMTADQTITVTVTDVDREAPGAPATPSVLPASVSSVDVSWGAPSNAGPPITDYDYRYRVKSPAGSWTEVTNTTISVTNTTITGLAEGTEYEVQVRATNAEGTGDWSAPPGSGSTDANAVPVFSSAATFSAAENQTAVGTVQASDSDAGDSVTDYAIQPGADAAQFTIVASSGVLTFVSAPNFEAPADADTNNHYVVVVRATSGTGAREKTVDQPITVTVTNVGGEAPGAPATPSVSSASVSSLNVSWTAPSNAGPPITDYDYQYRVKSPAGVSGHGDFEHDDHGVEHDDHGAGGGHRVRGAGAGGERRGHGRLVGAPGQRLDGRQRGAVVRLGGDVHRGGEPDRGGDGRGVGQRLRRQRDGLRDPTRRGRGAVHDRGLKRGADVRVGAELRGRGGCRHGQRLRGGGAGDQRHGRAGEDGGPDDHRDGDGRGRRGAGRPGHAVGVVGLGEQSERFLGCALERRAADHGLRLPVPGEVAAGVVDDAA